MIYLGQAVIFTITPTSQHAGGRFPAVFLGFQKSQFQNVESCRIVHAADGEITEEIADMDEIEFVRQEDSKSPTGKSIYIGSLAKVRFFPYEKTIKMKRPADDLLIKEFKIIKKHIK